MNLGISKRIKFFTGHRQMLEADTNWEVYKKMVLYSRFPSWEWNCNIDPVGCSQLAFQKLKCILWKMIGQQAEANMSISPTSGSGTLDFYIATSSQWASIKVRVTEVLKMMCPCLVLIKERSLGCGRVNYYSQPLVSVCHGKDGSRWRHNLCVHSHRVKPPHHVTDIRKAETRHWCKRGALLLSLSLCDFSQSRLLINYQIVNVKVIATPFHSGADKPAPINIPVSGCRSGRYDTHGLIPSLPCCCCCCRGCCCHVNLSTGGSQMPSKSASSTARGTSFN